MAIVLNAKGTSTSAFQVGKDGMIVYQNSEVAAQRQLI
jgi:hypothetical protein